MSQKYRITQVYPQNRADASIHLNADFYLTIKKFQLSGIYFFST